MVCAKPPFFAQKRIWLPAGDGAALKGSNHPVQRPVAQEQPRRTAHRAPLACRRTPTVMRMQWRSRGSPDSSLGPTMAASLATSFTRTMSMSFSQQKAWIRVKWICRAMSPSSSSSVASTQKATLSGSLQEGSGALSPAAGPEAPALRPAAAKPPRPAVLTHSSAWPTRRRRRWGSRGAAPTAAARGGPCRRPASCAPGEGRESARRRNRPQRPPRFPRPPPQPTRTSRRPDVPVVARRHRLLSVDLLQSHSSGSPQRGGSQRRLPAPPGRALSEHSETAARRPPYL